MFRNPGEFDTSHKIDCGEHRIGLTEQIIEAMWTVATCSIEFRCNASVQSTCSVLGNGAVRVMEVCVIGVRPSVVMADTRHSSFACRV